MNQEPLKEEQVSKDKEERLKKTQRGKLNIK